jgi:hypothetical protein
MLESKSGVLLIGGLGFFLFAFLSNGLVPVLMFKDLPEQSAEQLVSGNRNVLRQLADLKMRYGEAFEKHYDTRPIAERIRAADKNSDGRVSEAELPDDLRKLLAAGDADQSGALEGDEEIEQTALAVRGVEALRLGRQVYVGEGCWHCHSQFVRPVSNESRRWGEVSQTSEYQNELQRPVMFGTRRVGPDLSREGGRRSNDWHVAHFYRPTLVSPDSPMPEYPWLFDEVEGRDERDPAAKFTTHTPNQRGLALIVYIQWLGSWLDSYPYYEELKALDLEN